MAIIAAMEREIAPLVQSMKRTEVRAQDRKVSIFEDERVIVACGGIGLLPARIAADTAYKHANGQISLFVSAGLAGGIAPEATVGQVLQPAEIVSSADEVRIRLAFGSGVLVTAGTVTHSADKRIFGRRYKAQAVDMEAYAVADVARIYGVPAIAIKAISDEVDFPLPALAQFIDERGRFRTAGFFFYTLFRPRLWSTVGALARNSRIAIVALNGALRELIAHPPEIGSYNRVSAPTEVKQ